MKTNKISLFLSAFILLLSSCSKDDKIESELETQLSLSVEQLNFDADGNVMGEQSMVKISSSSDWRLIGIKDWCTPVAESGVSGAQLQFNVQPNTSDEERNEVFHVVCGSTSKKIKITQYGKAFITSANTKYTLAYSNRNIVLRLKTNAAFQVEIPETDKSWISVLQSQSLVEDWVTLSVTENTGNVPRTSVIKVIPKGAEPIEVTVHQLMKERIYFDKDKYLIDSKGGDVKIEITTNIDYRIFIPENVTWLQHKETKVEPSEVEGLKKITEIFTMGTTDKSRVVDVFFKSKNTTVKQSVQVNQMGNETLVDVPDRAFREYLIESGLAFIVDGIQVQLTAAGKEETWINCQERPDIKSLEGVQAFTKISNLICYSCSITELKPEWTKKMPDLTYIDIRNNFLTSLDLTEAPNVGNCYYTGNAITYINYGKTRLSLSNINFTDKNGTKTKKLVVVGERMKKTGFLDKNTEPEELDLSGCAQQLETVDVIMPKLKKLYLKTGQTYEEIYKNEDTEVIYK